MSIYLSKSKYCSAVQCPKMLWLKSYKPDYFDASVMNETVLETGNEVGDLAMGLFGTFVEVPFGNLDEMMKKTEELIADCVPVITEASFSYKGLFCSVDIMKLNTKNQVEIYEVKSSTAVKEIYYHDVAYQLYVLTHLGYEVKKVCIVHINKDYIRKGELDISCLFHIEDVTIYAYKMQSDVDTMVNGLEAYMEQEDEPARDIGTYCFEPYECGFFKYCTRNLPCPNVFDISGARLSTKMKCYDKGIISFEALKKNGVLSANQNKQIEYELCNMPAYIDKKAIRDFLQGLSYPLYFLDFESYQPAVPLFDNSKPFEQIVFQYSLHYIECESGELKHTEFLAYPGTDPRRALAERLCQDIPKNVCVTAYNMGFEKGRIKGLAQLYPDLAEHLMNIHDNIQDLMVPFQKKQYYCKEMHGSYSIKYVLPALFPNNSELNYHNLDGVHNGTEASAAFKKMELMSPDEMEEVRRNLLNYCKLDTFAMVKIWEKLNEVINSQ